MNTDAASLFARLPLGSVAANAYLQCGANRSAVFWPEVAETENGQVGIDGWFVLQDRLIRGVDPVERRQVVASIVEDPGAFARRVRNGRFNIIINDAKARRTIVINDEFGLLPLFATKRDGYYYLAGDLDTLRETLADSPEPLKLDELGLSQLYSFGYQIGNRTAYDGVFLQPPGTIMQIDWSTGQQTVEPWTKPASTDSAERLPANPSTEAICRFVADSFSRACERVYDEDLNYAIKLSGGFDSRLIAGSWVHKPMRSYTWGEPGSAEVDIGATLAALCGFTHTEIPVEGDFFSAVYPNMLKRFGLMEFFHEHAARLILEDGCQVTLDGLGGGDILGGLPFKRAGLVGTMREAVGATRRQTHHLDDRRVAESVYERILVSDGGFNVLTGTRRQLVADYREATIDELMQQIQALRTVDDTFESIVGKTGFYNRQRRYIALQAVTSRPRLETLFPFMDSDFRELVGQIPPRLLANKRMYLELFARGYPHIKAAKCIMSGMSFESAGVRVHFLGRIVRKLKDVLADVSVKFSAGRMVTRAMEATQWKRWLILNAEFRAALFTYLASSDAVDVEKLKVAMESAASGKLDASGTRIMLTASYAGLRSDNNEPLSTNTPRHRVAD